MMTVPAQNNRRKLLLLRVGSDPISGIEAACNALVIGGAALLESGSLLPLFRWMLARASLLAA